MANPSYTVESTFKDPQLNFRYRHQLAIILYILTIDYSTWVNLRVNGTVHVDYKQNSVIK